MESIIRTHLAHLRFAGYSERTIAARGSVLRAVRHLGPLPQLTEEQLLDWLSRPGLAPESRRAYRSHLRGFYAWATDRGLVGTDPTRTIPAVKVPRALPRPMAREDFMLAVDLADLRMRAWLLLGALAGLRAMEIAALLPGDLTVTDDGLAVLVLRVAKGGSVGIIPVHDALLRALSALPVQDARWWNVTPNHVTATVSTYLHGLGIDATLHRTRHLAATMWYRASDADLLAVQALMRHASVQSTVRYAQLAPTRPAEVVAAVSLSA